MPEKKKTPEEIAEARIEEARRTGATELDLSHLGLTELPESIGELTELQELNLEGNKLHRLPKSISRFTKLKGLYLHGNEALGIPPEVLGSRYSKILRGGENRVKPTDILGYYLRQIEKSSRRLNEAKVLILGQGGVGKTSLVRRLTFDNFERGVHKTEGINIARWEVPSKIADEKVRLNIWDFGGQEIMHATHQFFLTKRSLYLVVLDANRSENESNIHYWLKIIQSYGADAPVLVVVNKNEPPNQLQLNETRLSKDYAPNLRGFFRVSCETGAGINELRAAIMEHVNALPHVYDQVPASYFAVKEALEGQAKTKNFLDIKQYRGMCSRNGVGQKRDQDILIRFLHDLGNVLNFDDPSDPYELRDTNILNPEWVTGGVYKILNNNLLMQAGGKLDISQLGAILNDPKCYPEERHKFIIEMMRKFELCFDFPESHGQRVLIPELLPKNEPDLNWKTEESLNFQFHYAVLPEGVISRFIVKMHLYLTNNATYWRSGVVLEIDGNRALVRGDTQAGRVYISVQGPQKGRGNALTIIRHAFREVHSTIPKIGVQEKVPLPDDPNIVVDYNHLLRLEEFDTDSILPEGAVRPYRVRELLNSISEKPHKQASTHILHQTDGAKRDFDVFLSHNSKDKPSVRHLAEALTARGLKVWLDEWELIPGVPWQVALEDGIASSNTVAVLVGTDGIGPWDIEEMSAALRLSVRRKIGVIPVLLPGAPAQPELPLFLSNRTWVDLRAGITDSGLDRLLWGITGEKPRSTNFPTPPVSISEKPFAPQKTPLSEVFKTTGLPDYTYIEPTIYRKVADAIQSRDKHILLQGPSGSGKTSLIERIFRDTGLKNDVDYWRLHASDPGCSEQAVDILEKAILGEHHRIVVLDDAHLLDEQTRKNLPQRLKRLSDKWFQSDSIASFILIGNPTSAEAFLFDTVDLGPRLEVFSMPDATEQQLSRLISEGQQRLNIRFTNPDDIVTESYGSFYLCQYLCLTICQQQDIKDTQEYIREVNFSIQTVRELVVAQLTPRYKTLLLAFCKQGPIAEGIQNPIVTIVRHLCQMPRQRTVHLSKIIRRASDLGQGTQVTAFKSKINVSISQVAGGDLSKLLHYDQRLEAFTIEQPMFRYYLDHLNILDVLEPLGCEEELKDLNSVDRSVQMSTSGVVSTTTPEHGKIRDQVFISYSQKDKVWLEKLQTMLNPYIRNSAISVWWDGKIKPSQKWREEIDNALASAKVAVLLVSPNFLASDFIQDDELPYLLDAADREGVQLLWVLVRDCLYSETRLKEYQAAHKIRKPLNALRGAALDTELVEICRNIKAAANP